MILTDKQRAALDKFKNGSLLSPMGLMKLIPGLQKVEAVNRIAELRDKGAVRKTNQTQYGITKKGLTALGVMADPPQAASVETDSGDDSDKPLTDAEMDRLLDGAVEELAGDEDPDSIATLAALDVVVLNRELTADEATSFAADSTAPSLPLRPAPQAHPALVAIEQLKDQLTKPKPVKIDNLELKKEALVQLGRFLAQDICDLLVEIADDLDRAAGNEI